METSSSSEDNENHERSRIMQDQTAVHLTDTSDEISDQQASDDADLELSSGKRVPS